MMKSNENEFGDDLQFGASTSTYHFLPLILIWATLSPAAESCFIRAADLRFARSILVIARRENAGKDEKSYGQSLLCSLVSLAVKDSHFGVFLALLFIASVFSERSVLFVSSSFSSFRSFSHVRRHASGRCAIRGSKFWALCFTERKACERLLSSSS